MDQIWKIVPNVGTPYAVFAFIVAALLTGYFVWQRYRYKVLDKVSDPQTRLQMARDLLGVYVPEIDNLRIEDKVALLNKQIDHRQARFKLLIGAGFIVCVLILIATVLIELRPNPGQATELPKKTSLILRIEDEPSDKSEIPGLQQGVVLPVEFTLSNPLSGLAIVDELSLEVLEVIEDATGSTQALVASYKYPIELAPEKRGKIPFGAKFKYAPGEVDRIILGVNSATVGFDYFVRIVVRWYDGASAEKRETVSELLVLRFPAPFKADTPGRQRELQSQQQQGKIDERLRQLRIQVAKP